MPRFVTYENEDGDLSVMSEQEFDDGGKVTRKIIDEAEEYVWQFAPNAATALANHYDRRRSHGDLFGPASRRRSHEGRGRADDRLGLQRQGDGVMTRKTAAHYPFADKAEGDYVGRVEDVFFTQGGQGNQWTVIDGQRFVTYWDIRRTDWKVGDMVRFTVRHRHFGYWNHGEPPKAAHAEQIHRVVRCPRTSKWVLSPRDNEGKAA